MPRRFKWFQGYLSRCKRGCNLTSISLLHFVYRLLCIVRNLCHQIFLSFKRQEIICQVKQLFCFCSAVSSSSSFNCSGLMSSWSLIFFWISLSGGCLSRFLKCSFYFWSLSSWLSGIRFAFEVLYLPLTSFSVCQANCDCLFSTKFLIFSMRPGMYSDCSFCYETPDVGFHIVDPQVSWYSTCQTPVRFNWINIYSFWVMWLMPPRK